MREVVIASAARTPIGAFGGSLKDVSPVTLGEIAVKEAIKRAGITPEQVDVYTTQGGTPFLDGGYTVFGEVEEGLEIVETIQNMETSMGDRPKTDVVMNVTVLE